MAKSKVWLLTESLSDFRSKAEKEKVLEKKKKKREAHPTTQWQRIIHLAHY